MPLAIGIDIGGTNIKGALFNLNTGECLDKKMTLTRDGEQVDDVLAWAAGAMEMVSEFEKQSAETGLPVGISAPGLAADDGTHISFMPGRMNGLAGFDWPAYLQRNCRVLNDAHAALLGEIWQGAAKGARDVILLTFGTAEI